MSSSNKNISRIIKYLNNELSERERYAFEREMEADPFLMDAIEGYEKIDTEQINESLTHLKNKLSSKYKKRILPLWTKIAAGILFIIGISSLFFISTNNPSEPLLSKQQEEKTNTELQEAPMREAQPIDNSTNIQLKDNNIKIESNSENNSINKKEVTLEKHTPIAKLSTKKINYSTKENSEDSDSYLKLEQEFELEAEKKKNVLTGTIEGDKIEPGANYFAADREIDQSLLKDSFIQYKGKVVDESGSPLPGVTIIQEGKPNGTITDMDGNFTLNTTTRESMLSFDFIGYKQKKVLANKDSIGEVILEDDAIALEEVVTVGYGTVKQNKEKPIVMENNLIPSPIIGIKKFTRKIENSIKLPANYKNNEIKVNIFISETGEISDIKIITPVNEKFDSELKLKIKELGLWETAVINNKPTKGSRLVIFKF